MCFFPSFFPWRCYLTLKNIFVKLEEIMKKIKMGDEEKKLILINSVRVPVSAFGMINFFSTTSFILKMDHLHFQAFYIIYTHEYYKMLRTNTESSLFKYTSQLFFTKLDALWAKRILCHEWKMKEGAGSHLGDTGTPPAPWAQALGKPRAAPGPAWHSGCNGHSSQGCWKCSS